MKRMLTYAIFFLAIGFSIFVIADFLMDFPFAGKAVQATPSSPIHWHIGLGIVVIGEELEIPADIGMGQKYSGNRHYDHMMGMTSMHTHDSSGTIHWEVMKPPMPEDLRLGNFFEVWGKSFSNKCILEFCNNRENKVRLFVNGEERNEFEKYLIRDGDNILIEFG